MPYEKGNLFLHAIEREIGRERFDVLVRFPRELRDDPEAIARNTLVPTRAGAMVPLGELAKLAPQPDEWDTLNAEHARLSHGQSILDAARLALDMVSEAELNADSLTSRAIDALEEVAAVEPRLGNALEVLREAQAQLQDAAHSLNSVLGHTELDPDRLGELDSRMSVWMGLARRYRRQPHELPELLQGWQAELAELDAATDLAALERAAEQKRMNAGGAETGLLSAADNRNGKNSARLNEDLMASKPLTSC